MELSIYLRKKILMREKHTNKVLKIKSSPRTSLTMIHKSNHNSFKQIKEKLTIRPRIFRVNR